MVKPIVAFFVIAGMYFGIPSAQSANRSNVKPTIDAISNPAAIDEDAISQQITLTGISAGAGDIGQIVTVTAVSSNPGLVANPSITYTSPNTSALLDYTPIPNMYGTVVITVTVLDDGGTAGGGIDTASETFTITINPINDAPTFTLGPDQSILEDAGSITLAWATDIEHGGENEGGQNLTFGLAISASTGSLAFDLLESSNTGVLSYKTSLHTLGTATIDLTLADDGSGVLPHISTSAVQTFTITVEAVNDAPTFSKGSDISVDEDDGAFLATAWVTGIDEGGLDDEDVQTLTFEATIEGTTSNLAFISAPSISPDGDLAFEASPNTNGTAIISVILVDDGAAIDPDQNASGAQTFIITVVGFNDAPFFTAGANLEINEDASTQQLDWATEISAGIGTDESSQQIEFVTEITGTSNGLTFQQEPAIGITGILTYETAENSFGTATIEVYLIDDGDDTSPHQNISNTATFNIVVNPLNDAPTFTKGNNIIALEDEGIVGIPGWASDVVPGPDNEADQTAQFTIVTLAVLDPLVFNLSPLVDATGNLEFHSAENENGVISLAAILTDNGNSNELEFNSSNQATFSLTVVAVNDQPIFTGGADQQLLEGDGFQSIPDWATNISPGGGPDEAEQELLFTTDIIEVTGTLVFDFNPQVSVAGTLSYQPTNNTAGTATIEVKLLDNESNTAPNDNESEGYIFTIDVTAINNPASEILLSNNEVIDNSEVGTEIGIFTVFDPDVDDIHTLILDQGEGDDGNEYFTIVGDRLLTNSLFDADEQSSYSIRVETSDGSFTFDKIFQIDVLKYFEDNVEFSNAITPNGDGANDTWVIEGIDRFPAASVQVFNKAGQRVFSSVGYFENWDGTFNNSTLPMGSYYYIIDLKNGTGIKKGVINIIL